MILTFHALPILPYFFNNKPSAPNNLDDAEWSMLVKELEWIRKEEAKKNRILGL